MALEYTYTVIHADEIADVMELEYVAAGMPRMRVGMPLPREGQRVADIAEIYAPVARWADSLRQKVRPEVGETGVLVAEQLGEKEEKEMTLEEAQVEKLKEIELWRIGWELGGVTLNGQLVDTSPMGQALLMNTFTAAEAGLLSEAEWRNADGTFSKVDVRALKEMVQAVTDHVQDSYRTEKILREQVAQARTVEEVKAIVPGPVRLP